jgi:metal-responsive CopG/Arc/MetJ family transcriptional regulator
MSMIKIAVDLPTDLLREIDKLAGKRGRNAFLVEAVRNGLARRRSSLSSDAVKRKRKSTTQP